MARGETAEAVRLGEEGYGYAIQGVSPEQGSSMLIQLARARAQQGDLVRACQEAEQAEADAERIGEFANAASAALLLSELSLREGDIAGARLPAKRAYDRCEPRLHRADFTQVCRRTFSRLGCLAEEEGDLATAAHWHARALDRLEDDFLSGNPLLATLIEGLAAFNAASGDHLCAAELLGTAHTLLGFRNDSSYEARRTAEAATEALGEEAFTAAYIRGRDVTREQVLCSLQSQPQGAPDGSPLTVLGASAASLRGRAG